VLAVEEEHRTAHLLEHRLGIEVDVRPASLRRDGAREVGERKPRTLGEAVDGGLRLGQTAISAKDPLAGAAQLG